MAFAAKGTDITNPTQTDEAIAYGLEFGRIGMDGASRYLILKGRMGKFGGGGLEGTGSARWWTRANGLVEVGTKRSFGLASKYGRLVERIFRRDG